MIQFNGYRFRSLHISLLALLTCASAFAQNDLATIRGVVTDQSDAVVPKAHITLVNQATNVSRESDGNDKGEFEFPFVGQGNYRLTVVSPGFKSFVASDVVIGAREQRRIDAKLELGAVGS